MKNNKKFYQLGTLAVLSVLALFTALLLTLPALVLALDLPDTPHKAFLKEFADGYRAGKTQYLTNSLRANKRNVRAVVQTLIDEAAKKEFAERMELLDIANALASMHKHWNFDDEPLKLVEAVLEKEMARERARREEAAKWASYEKFPGNVLFRTNPARLEGAKVSPVIFPHWRHRLLFECAACHDSLFKIDRSSRNAKRPSAMHQPLRCGACHNSKTAFGIADSKANCNRCHSAGIDNEKSQVYNAKSVTDGALKRAGEKAQAIGGTFKPEKLKDGLLPKDRFGDIDWIALKKSGAYSPAATAVKGSKGDRSVAHASTVLFEVPDSASWIGPVPFKHKVHTPGIECATCHASLFDKELKAKRVITMQQMAQGESCGACHNKVAFKLADCMKCHTNGLSEKELGSILKRGRVE